MRHGYAELQAGAVTGAGPYVRGELGWRPASPWSVFGFGEWAPGRSSVGAGLRYVW